MPGGMIGPTLRAEHRTTLSRPGRMRFSVSPLMRVIHPRCPEARMAPGRHRGWAAMLRWD